MDDIIPHGQHFYGSVLLSSEEIVASNPTSIRGYLSVHHVIYICSHIQNVNKHCLQVLVLKFALNITNQTQHNMFIYPVSSDKLKLIVCLFVCVCGVCIWLTTLTCRGSEPGLSSLLVQLPEPPERSRTEDDADGAASEGQTCHWTYRFPFDKNSTI